MHFKLFCTLQFELSHRQLVHAAAVIWKTGVAMLEYATKAENDAIKQMKSTF